MRGQKPASDLSIIFPGKLHPIFGPGGQRIEVTIRPMSFHAVTEYADKIADVYNRLAAAGADFGSLFQDGKPVDDFKDRLAPMMPKVIPIVLAELKDLANQGIDGVDLEDAALPHWVGPELVAAWFEETFSDPSSLRTWADAMGMIASILSGKKPSPATLGS